VAGPFIFLNGPRQPAGARVIVAGVAVISATLARGTSGGARRWPASSTRGPWRAATR